MKQITVRNVDERAIKRAREVARKRGISLNRVYSEAIEKGLGIEGKQPCFNDLDAFAGDSDFGPQWERIINEDLSQIDEKEWQ